MMIDSRYASSDRQDSLKKSSIVEYIYGYSLYPTVGCEGLDNQS